MLRSERLWLALALAALVFLLTLTEALWDWDQVLYDRVLRLPTGAPANDIVIIAIDEYSLAAMQSVAGARWPWPRATHAGLINRLGPAGTRAILLDLLFTEADARQPDNDLALGTALQKFGQTVVPVHLAPLASDAGADSRYALVFPIPQVAATAGALGHTHAGFDRDGLLRETSLALASGEQRVPHASLAMAVMLGLVDTENLPGARAGVTEGSNWYRDYTTRFRFAGRDGYFKRISYVQALEMSDAEMRESFNGKIVFIGATAPGLDLIPTPVSATHPMPGVEVNANIFSALRTGKFVTSVTPLHHAFISLVLVLVPYLLFAKIRSRYVIWLSAITIGFTLLASAALLYGTGLWIGPAPAAVGVLVAYLAWSFRRLGNAVRFLTRELERLERQTRDADDEQQLKFERAARHVVTTTGAHSLMLVGLDGNEVERHDVDTPDNEPQSFHWQRALPNGLTLHATFASEPEQTEVPADLEAFARQLSPDTRPRPRDAIERVERRIAQVRKASERLQRLRKFVAQTLENMASGVIVVDPFGDVRDLNEIAARYAGRERTQLRGQNIVDVLDKVEFNGESLTELLRRVQLFAETVYGYATSEDGVDLIVHITPFGNEHLPHGAIVSLSDISELRDSERRRAEMLGFISHDLRAPLVSTLALTQIATLKPERLTDGKTVARIEDNVRKTLSLADDFLHLARAESNDALAAEQVDLAAAARAAVEQLQALAEQKNIVLDIHLADGVTLSGEPGLLERAILNLVSNAIKYSGNGARVDVSVSANESHAYCEVADTGLGIPSEALASLFDCFTRVASGEHRKRGGAGLGLAFVKTVAERHRGDVTVTSTEGRGSTFKLTLPRETSGS